MISRHLNAERRISIDPSYTVDSEIIKRDEEGQKKYHFLKCEIRRKLRVGTINVVPIITVALGAQYAKICTNG